MTGTKLYIYHFVNPSGNKIKKFAEDIYDYGAVLCFDLEDIVKDLDLSPDNSAQKKLHRDNVINTIDILFNNFFNPLAGIRINAFNSDNYFNDVEAVSAAKWKTELNCIFLPKVEDAGEIKACGSMLKKLKIQYKEIIPIIESVNGYNNIKKILSDTEIKIDKIAFGHCDYNYSMNNFPFYHHNTTKYWEWLKGILEIVKNYNIQFINSPYLLLDDIKGFQNNLWMLHGLNNGNFGQITLSYGQTKIASIFDGKIHDSNGWLTEQPVTVNSLEFAGTIIKDFEINRLENRSFSLDRKSRVIISPQEYLAAKKYVAAASGAKRVDIKMLIIGGCFPFQDNIRRNELYHKILKNKLETGFNIHLTIKIIRYENIFTCLNEISRALVNEKPELVIFHLRIEPLLGLFKIYFRHLNKQGTLITYLRIAIFNIALKIKSNKSPLKNAGENIHYIRSKKINYRVILKELNYLFGYLSGNLKYTFNIYANLLKQVIDICRKEDMKIIFTGPVSRPRSFFENYFSGKLNSYMALFMARENQIYINCLGTEDEHKEALMCEDLIRVSKQGHLRIAGLLYEAIILHKLIWNLKI